MAKTFERLPDELLEVHRQRDNTWGLYLPPTMEQVISLGPQASSQWDCLHI